MLIDITQVLLAITIVILTALLTVLGIEVFYILKDARKLIERVNTVLGDAEQVVQNVKKPTEMIASVSHSAELLTKIFEAVKVNDQRMKEENRPIIVEQGIRDQVVTTEPAKPKTMQEPTQQMPVPQVRRFFRMPRSRAS